MCQVTCRHQNLPICDPKRDLHLWYATWCWRDADNLKASHGVVRATGRYQNLRLAIGRGAENRVEQEWDNCARLDERRENSVELNAEILRRAPC